MTGPGTGVSEAILTIITHTFQPAPTTSFLYRFPVRIKLQPASLDGMPYPWSTSVWVCVLFAGAAFLIASLLYRFRVRRMEEELTTLFHKRLSERANLAIDLNDSLLQTIEASKLIADDALESSSDPDRTRSAMARLSYWLGNAAVEGQAALNSLRKATYDGNDLASGFQRAAEECLTHRSLDFVVTTTGNSKDMQPMVRDEIYLLGYEIISNFYRRTDANRLEISLIYGADFSMRVKSSGQMPRAIGGGAEMSSPFDLHRMQRRVQRFGATLSLGTPSSSSVELTLTVPGNIIFTRSAPLLPQWLLLLWQRVRSRKSSTE